MNTNFGTSTLSIEERENAALQALEILIEAEEAALEAKARIKADVRAPYGAMTLAEWALLAEEQNAINLHNEEMRAEIDAAERLMAMAKEEIMEMLPENVSIRLGTYRVWYAVDRWNGRDLTPNFKIEMLKEE